MTFDNKREEFAPSISGSKRLCRHSLAWAAEEFQNDQLKFDLSEPCGSDFFDVTKDP